MDRISASSIISLMTAALLAASCAQESQPSTFYVLSYPQSGLDHGPTTTMRDGLAVGIGPVELPQYLDRPQIVTRATANQLSIEEFDRWGGRLKENFASVLAEVLSAELDTDRITVHPWASAAPVEFQVIVNVMAFDTDTDGVSRLDARWSIVNVRRQEILVTARSTFRQQVTASQSEASSPDPTDHDAVAAAMSRNVVDLGREVARHLRSLSAS